MVFSVEKFKKATTILSPSPRKAKEKLRCSVLTKSPLKDTKTGTMFSLTLSDQNPSSTIRALCFEGKNMFEAFKPLTTYEMANFKVKRSLYGDKNIEILIDSDTELKESSIQYKMEKSTFSIAQIIHGETQNVRHINLKAKVIAIEDIATVGKYPNHREKRDVLLADSTGAINLVLWQERAKEISFAEQHVLQINNAIVSTFNKTKYLTTSMETSYQTIDEALDVDTTLHEKTVEKPHIIKQLQNHIEAYKEYITMVRCINCLTQISYTPGPMTTRHIIIKCTSCSTVFRAKAASVINECKFLITQEWYTAKSTVVQHLFQRNESVIAMPSDDETTLLLNSKFSLRLDLETKTIEEAFAIPDNAEQSPVQDEDDEDVITDSSSKKMKTD